MSIQMQHPMLPKATHDEHARQEFVRSFKIHLASKVSPGNRTIYERDAEPEFIKRHGRKPADHREVETVMTDKPHYQVWSSLQRTSQEMMWDAVSTSVDRQSAQLIAAAKELAGRKEKLGSLSLDPSLEVPRYHLAVDIHCMPGGYHTDLAADDVAAGAIYDRAVHIYAMARLGPLNEDMGETPVLWLKNTYPDFKPERILDMGCAIGNSTLPWVDAFPDAEVHGIDVGAPVLRYAHARSEGLGKRVHYSQQNAEHTNFESGSFDLIVSHIMFHETSQKAMRNILKECHRLLKPGGMMVHVEAKPYEGMHPYDAFMLDWDTFNNNEPFWRASHSVDYGKESIAAGFDPDKVTCGMIPSALGEAVKARTALHQGGDFGGSGEWFVFAATK